MTPTPDMIRAFSGRHAFVSFENPEQMEIAAEICQSVALDNGAFSAWRGGREHNFDGYQAWAADWLKHPAVDWCVIPDVIDGNEIANDALLNAWQLPKELSVPVFHLHESLDRLERLVASYPRISLGSSGDYSEPGAAKWWGRMSEVMGVVCDGGGLPRVKLHGLRMLDPVIFSHLPLSSADSCNVARNVGIDLAWNGPYAPKSRASRALILMGRIEAHASASKWNSKTRGVQHNLELIG